MSKMARKYKATVETPFGSRRCFQVSVERGESNKPLVARFGGIPLRRQKNAVLTDRVQALTDRELVPQAVRHKELVSRLLVGRTRYAGARRRCKCTKSANSPISSRRASKRCPRG